MLKHSAVVVALALEYQGVVVGVTPVPDVTVFVDDEAAVVAAAAVALQPVNNHIIRCWQCCVNCKGHTASMQNTE
jgi:hypothetical protein